MDELFKFLGEHLGKIILSGGGVFSVAAIKHITTKLNLRAKRDQRILANRCRIEVDSIIVAIQAITSANRVNLWQYSNGTKDLNNICFENVTCTSEKTDGNTIPIKQDFIHQPLDLYMRKIIDRISLCDNDYLMVDIDSEYYDDAIIMEMYGNKMIYNFKIFRNNVWNGVVTLSFDDRIELSAETTHKVLISMANIRRLHQKMIN